MMVIVLERAAWRCLSDAPPLPCRYFSSRAHKEGGVGLGAGDRLTVRF